MAAAKTTGTETTSGPSGAGKRDELLVLSRVSAALSGLWDLDAILRVALDNVLAVMDGAVGGILLLDEATQTLSYRVYQGLSEDYVSGVHLSLGQGVAGRVAETGKAILLEDISKDPHVAYADMVATEGIKAFISVPLQAKERVLGVINVASHTPRRFTPRDMHLLHSIGDQLGVAIEQARLYQRVRRTRERYRQLARQTLLAKESERKRFARELHDETSQTLSGLTLQIQALIGIAERGSTSPQEMVERLKKVLALAVQVHTETSHLIANLHPATLDTLGLMPAVRHLAEDRLRPMGIKVSEEIHGLERRLPPEVEAAIFRFFQGAIGNIVQHSGASNVTLTLEDRGDEVLIRISDDGCGFDVSAVTSIEEDGRGRGVFSMKERIALLGGHCKIESQPGQGTVIRAVVPTTGWRDDDEADHGPDS